MYNKVNGTDTKLTSAAGESGTGVVVTPTFANSEKTQVKFTITNTTVAGFPQGGLSNGGYIFYASSVDDKATVANTIVAASPYEFNGTLTPDTSASNLITASYNKGTGSVTLNFDKAVTATAPADDKLYFQSGDTKVYLKNATDYTSIAGSTQVTFSLSDATLDAVNALSNPQLVVSAGAFVGSGLDCAQATITPTVIAVPMITGVTYNDTTNRMTFTFSDTMNVSKFATAISTGNKIQFESTTGVYSNVVGTVVTATNSNQLTVVVDQATARLLDACTIASPKIRVNEGNVATRENVTNLENTASTPVQMVEKDYTGIFSLTHTPLSVVSAEYKKGTRNLVVTFNKNVRNDGDDSRLVQLWKDGVSIGYVATPGGASAATAIGSTETADAKTLTFAVANAGTTSTPAFDAVLDSEIVSGSTYAVSIGAGALTEQSGATTFAVAPANKVAVTYTPAADSAPTVATGATLSVDGPSYVKAKFSVAVDKALAEDTSNYIAYLVADPTVTFSFDSAKLLSDDKTVYLHSTTALTLADGSYKIGIKNIAAKVGGAIMTSTYAAADSQALKSGVALAAPALTDSAITATNTTDQSTAFTDNGTAGMNAGDTFVVTFDKPVVVDGNVSGVHDVVFTNNNNHDLGTGNITVTPGDYANQLKVSLGTGYTAALGDKIGIKAGQTAIKFYDATTAVGTTDENKQVLAAPTTATAAPAVKSAVYADANNDGKVSAGDTLTVVFDQNLDPNGVAVTAMTAGTNATDTFVLPAGTSVGNAPTFAYTGADTVTITLGGTGIDLDATAALSYLRGLTVKAGTNNPVRNTWTVVADGNGTAKTVTSADTTRPSITGATYSTTYDYTNGTAGAGTDKVIIVSFGEKVNAADMDAAAIANNFALSSGYSFGTAPVAKVVNGQVVIKLDANAVFDAGITTINVVAGDTTQTAVDASGNKISRNASSASGYVVTAQ